MAKAPVIHQPSVGDAYPLLKDFGSGLRPSIALDPCACCDEGLGPPVSGTCLCAISTKPAEVSVSLTINDVDPPFVQTTSGLTHVCVCDECEQVTGTYVLASTSDCCWGYTESPGLQLCPPPDGFVECNSGAFGRPYLYFEGLRYCITFTNTSGDLYDVLFRLETSGGVINNVIQWAWEYEETNVEILESYDCNKTVVLDLVLNDGKCDPPATVTVTPV